MAVLAGVVATPLIWFLVRSRLRSGPTKMVLVGAASGEAVKDLWIGALRSAGIRPHVINVGDFAGYEGPVSTVYSYEIWVPARMRRGRARRWDSRPFERLYRIFTFVKALFTEVFTVVSDTVSHDA